jgi:CheY-like chemotaxis protein
VERAFAHIAESKGLRFSVHFAADLPQFMEQDQKRLQQIVKNLLSNAFKFTERGEVEFTAQLVTSGWNPALEALNRADQVIAFAVRDTGIGIPLDKQEIIFEAFQQADGSMSRRYGGTGLGLAISREIAQLLGGAIQLHSARGRGSLFTLYLPRVCPAQPVAPARGPLMLTVGAGAGRAPSASETLEAERAQLAAAGAAASSAAAELAAEGRRRLLIVEPDELLARALEDAASRLGWSAIIAESGARAVALLQERQPDAIALDLALPDIDGLRVLRRIKADPQLRHIPVQALSADGRCERARALGAWAALAKPLGTDAAQELLTELFDWIEKPAHDVLVLSERADELVGPLQECGGSPFCAGSLEEASAAAERHRFAFALLDAQFPETSAPALLSRARGAAARRLPLLLYGASSRELHPGLDGGALLARDVPQLLDRAALLLHRPLGQLPGELRAALRRVQLEEASLLGRTALVVDDDVRNIFALSSVLEREGMIVRAAEDGRSAIESLRRSGGVDVLLLDIMMPGMDGFETMRRIRRMPRFREVPIIAVTAKAMKGDAEKTLAAGAWCYLAKPVDPERVLAVLRAWLHR